MRRSPSREAAQTIKDLRAERDGYWKEARDADKDFMVLERETESLHARLQ